MPYIINSRDDSTGGRTRLEISDDFKTATFGYFKGGRLQHVMTADIGGLFAARFSKFDLAAQKMFWGYVEYRPGAVVSHRYVDDVGTKDENLLEIVYDAPGALVVPQPVPQGLTPLTLPAPPPGKTAAGSISVTVTLDPAGTLKRPSNNGWINFDVRHGFPAFVPASSRTEAWEESLDFPILRNLRPAAAALPLEAVTGPFQFAAVYARTDSADKLNAASGVAVHVDDVHGHRKAASYDAAARALAFTLRNSIHLRGREFVRAEGFALSGGDAYGFGGNLVRHRLRAFHVEGACAGAPVGWHDALDIYRRWLRARFQADETSLFYEKAASVRARPRNTPNDEMSPHTVIANYGLDGAVDAPDPAPPPGAPHLSRWLEMHPLRDKYPDIPGNTNDSALDILKRIKGKFPDPSAFKLEAQIWGFERAGFYQFVGSFPPLCVTLTGSERKFANAVEDLLAAGIVASATTAPLQLDLNRYRYAGHLRWAGGSWDEITDPSKWKPFITEKFPASFGGGRRPVTSAKIKGKQFDRVWLVEHPPLAAADPAPDSAGAATLSRNQKRDEFGRPAGGLSLKGSGMYRVEQKVICPTEEVARLYLDGWVKPWLLDQGVRIVEFMKQGQRHYYCYNAEHQHVVAHDAAPDLPAGAPYTNVIGYGSWHVARLQSIFHDLHEAGRRFDGDGRGSFRLMHEFPPHEALAPYVDQYYWADERYHFLYSHLSTPIMSLGRSWATHPGYREERKPPARDGQKAPEPGLVPPAYMLDPKRDEEDVPQPYETGPAGEVILKARDKLTADEENNLRLNYQWWRAQCVAYFDQNFRVAEYGVAPRSYPVEPLRKAEKVVAWNAQAPLAQTNPRTYTYNRCVQDVFDLRAQMFDTAARAVAGERVIIPSVWLEEPRDYDDEAVNVSVRAATLQMGYRDFFRKGFMLGETRILKVNGAAPKPVWAWGSVDSAIDTRPFDDCPVLVHDIGKDDDCFGSEWRNYGLGDFISRGWDKFAYNSLVAYRRIEHRVWQLGEGDARRVLYAFANLGNSTARVTFLYGRGLEGVAQSDGWKRTISVIGPTPARPATDRVWCGMPENALTIPARSFAAVEVKR